MFLARKARWGSRELEITDVGPPRGGRTAIARLPLRRPVRSASRFVRPTRPTISCSASGCSMRKASAVTAPTPNRRDDARGLSGEAEATFVSPSGYGRRHVQDGRCGPQAGRVSVRLPSVAVHVPCEVPHTRRRHLPSEAHMEIFWANVRFKSGGSHLVPQP